MVKCIALFGHKKSGKDTVASYLCKKYGYTQHAFADPIKHGCKEIFNLTDEQLYGTKKDIVDSYWNVKPREIFQFLGTDIFQKIIGNLIPKYKNSPMFWVDRLYHDIIAEKIVISDVRFTHEYNAINKWFDNKLMLRVESGYVSADPHISEHEFETFRYDAEIPYCDNICNRYSAVDSTIDLFEKFN